MSLKTKSRRDDFHRAGFFTSSHYHHLTALGSVVRAAFARSGFRSRFRLGIGFGFFGLGWKRAIVRCVRGFGAHQKQWRKQRRQNKYRKKLTHNHHVLKKVGLPLKVWLKVRKTISQTPLRAICFKIIWRVFKVIESLILVLFALYFDCTFRAAMLTRRVLPKHFRLNRKGAIDEK